MESPLYLRLPLKERLRLLNYLANKYLELLSH